MDDINLAETLAEYISEEFADIQVEVYDKQQSVCIYSASSETCADGTSLLKYIGMIQILGDRMLFKMGGSSPLTRDNTLSETYDLKDPNSFDHLFEKTKEIIDICSKSKIETRNLI